jgi:adenine-specific DNA-methyltransferase
MIKSSEYYQFTWPGKNKSILLANSPNKSRLQPYLEESIDFDTTENLYIEGDNLNVLKLLCKDYLNRVKLIYIDPPYNTGKDCIYKNNFHQSAHLYYKEYGDNNIDGRFHVDWLNMIYPRLKVAKNLLANDGVFICAIDANELPQLSMILLDLFSESYYEHSYVSVVHNPRGQQNNNISYVNEYLIFIYPLDGKKYIADFPKDKVDSRMLRDSGTESNRTDARSCFYPFYVKDNRIVRIGDIPSDDFHPPNANIPQPDGTIEIWPMTDDGDEKKWRYARHSVESILHKLIPKMGRNNIQIIFNKDMETMKSVWANARYDSSEYGTKLLKNTFGSNVFSYPKSLYAVYDCVKAVTQNDNEAIVLDFFSGSATTAHAVMQINASDNGHRKYIMVQLPENLDDVLNRVSDIKTKIQIQNTIKFLDSIGKPHNICEIGKERIRRVGKKIKEETGIENLDIGFKVFKEK